MGLLDGKVAIVTGAGHGIGRGHALELAKEGATVLVNDLGATLAGEGTGRDADLTVNLIEERGGAAAANYEDVADVEGAARMIDQAIELFGRLDIVVNNAGIARDATIWGMTEADWDSVIRVHLKGTFAPTQAAVRHWRERSKAGDDVSYGRIINTTSGAGLFGNFGQANYGAAKMGLVGLARVLAVEGPKNGIRVNVIAPIARTRMTEEILGDKADQLGPELISPLVAYLAHESCDRNGAIYSVGGGRIARVFLGVTPGVMDQSLTAESIADSIDQIDDTDDFFIPARLNDEIRVIYGALS